MDSPGSELTGIFTEEERLDLSRAHYSLALSQVILDDSKQAFFSSIDRLMYRKPWEIAQKILQAAGFETNFENILSCLEDMVIGVKAAPLKAAPGQQKPTEFMPGIFLRFPSKHRVGPLLQKFYEQIALTHAQAEMSAKMLKASAKEEGVKEESAEQRKQTALLQQQNHQLSLEVSHLIEEVRQLQTHLSEQVKVDARISLAGHSSWQEAQVRSIDWDKLEVLLRTDKVTVRTSLLLIGGVPDINASCFVLIEDGVLKDVAIARRTVKPFSYIPACVTSVGGSMIAVRLGDRRLLKIAKDRYVAAAGDKVGRGSAVIVCSFEDKLLGIFAGTSIASHKIMMRIQEDILQEEIRQERVA